MLRLRYRRAFESTTAAVFDALIRVVGRSRWACEPTLTPLDEAPTPGATYSLIHERFARRGRVVECRPPVMLTLYESIVDPPCRVRLRLRWRLEPWEPGCLILLDAGYQLNGAAFLNRRHWRVEVREHCLKLLDGISIALETSQGVGVSGQKIGNNTMTATKTTAVSGKPSFK